ncbi:putative ankyrin and het domain-containing protein [Botrytis fragariae]|uniref:Putative ankyrin and het domain-containing protein n=1 Tax=Botrytis fragariae TaxID=1964551 RepID=A0A8H6AQ07_9HELO|nr:putative ankyrin and het domain-containing protein [Botrytis fragariae]KAF5871539.1 putative ankyrin and het domain-containing protein [Botrytis fragariae]
MASAIYRSLDDTIQEIRVLRILPGKTGFLDEILACTFEYVSLADKPTFAALSYTWGDVFYDEGYSTGDTIPDECSAGLPSARIAIDGLPTKVGRNLLDALKYFRSEAAVKTTQRTSPPKPCFTPETRLWADALCINQEDLIERNQQVSIMHQIYKHASRILVWPSIPHCEGQRELAAIIDSFGNDHWNTTQSLLRSHNTKLITILQNPQFDKCWEALEKIHKSTYWNRLWIVQEVLSNSETWVYVGEELIPLLPLLAISLALQYLDNSEIETLPPYTTYVIESVRIPANLPLLDGKLNFSDPTARPMELLDILQTFRRFECRDPRDKVYGLAGLSNTYHQKLTIDYSKSVAEIYKDVARLIIETTHRLEIICADENTKCHCPSGSHEDLSSLPTWVPNWSCIRDGTGLRPGLLRGRTADHLFQWNASGNMLINAQISEDGNMLNCRGVHLATITHIVHPVDDHGPLDFRSILELFHKTYDINSSNQVALFAALRKTLLKTGYIGELVSHHLPVQVFLKICNMFLAQTSPLRENDAELVSQLFYYLKMAMEDRCFYTGMTTEDGRGNSVMGVTFPFSREGDVIAVLHGCRWPVLLRRRGFEERDGFTVLGEVYVNGFMNGEGLGLEISEKVFEIY